MSSKGADRSHLWHAKARGTYLFIEGLTAEERLRQPSPVLLGDYNKMLAKLGEIVGTDLEQIFPPKICPDHQATGDGVVTYGELGIFCRQIVCILAART